MLKSEPQARRITELIEFIWSDVKPASPAKHGVAERIGVDQPSGYPANAFHTYWALRALEAYSERLGLQLSDELIAKQAVAKAWAERVLATETALIATGAEDCDASQLAWSIAILTRFPDSERTITNETKRQELLGAALNAFFSQQLESGGWPLYQPLFHYPQSGNAYCYTFETLAELIRPALKREAGRALRQVLWTHRAGLLRAWHSARQTRIRLGAGAVGWCSGHHPHLRVAEGWATAMTFEYIQLLVRLIGSWTAEAAAEALEARRPQYDPEVAEEKLKDRGESWTASGHVRPDDSGKSIHLPTWTVSRVLASLFLHPIAGRDDDREELDPDRPLIAENQARSAILMGPPGTSKTTLCEALAGALDWHFVQVHASDFLKEGIDSVPRRADEIFLQLMELDRCVVLFDEIDELIRARQGDTTVPAEHFTRFLTTLMLPKWTELWAQRRVLFFVATNSTIGAIDPAIARSQRFDATIFVPPPSFGKKAEHVKELLGYLPTSLDEANVENSLRGTFREDDCLGVFALLRWDQLDEFADRIKSISGTDIASEKTVRSVLVELADHMAKTDWRSSVSEDGDIYAAFKEYAAGDQHDHRVKRIGKLAADEVATDPLEPYTDDKPEYRVLPQPLNWVRDEENWTFEAKERRYQADALMRLL